MTVARRAVLAALLAAVPCAGTIWTRSTSTIKVPRRAKESLAHAVYTTRDWTVEVKDASASEGEVLGDAVLVRWSFGYRNTDSVPHYASVNVQYRDMLQNARGQFTSKVTLPPTAKEDGATVEISTKSRTDDWKGAMLARVTIDFLSTPEG